MKSAARKGLQRGELVPKKFAVRFSKNWLGHLCVIEGREVFDFKEVIERLRVEYWELCGTTKVWTQSFVLRFLRDPITVVWYLSPIFLNPRIRVLQRFCVDSLQRTRLLRKRLPRRKRWLSERNKEKKSLKGRKRFLLRGRVSKRLLAP